MKEYVIFTDSSADLDEQMVNDLQIEVLPLTFKLGEKEYANWPDGREITNEKFYAQLRAGEVSVTSQVNVGSFVNAFRPLLESGKDILYLGFSSGLSGTYNSGKLAAEELREEFPQATIITVDTLAASLGQGLLVKYAAGLKQEGKTIEEVSAWVEENKFKLAHWFTVDDLKFLQRGGRVSGAAALFGGMLHIKPVMHVDDAGKLIPQEKVRGRKQSLNSLVDHMEKTMKPDIDIAFISHGDCIEEAEYVANEIRSRLGVQEIYINHVGPVIASHSGPGTMALFFMANTRD